MTAKTKHQNTKPHNTEIEDALLGALLMNPAQLSDVGQGLSSDDFYIVKNGWVFSAMLALQEQGADVDYLTLCDCMERAGKLEEAGGPGWVSSLLTVTPTAMHAASYARIIRRLALRRRLELIAGEIVERARDDDSTAPDVLARAKAQIDELLGEVATDGWKWETLVDAFDEIPPTEWLVQGVIPLPSVTIVYGHPGTLKTMIAQDLAICVVGGKAWLRPTGKNPTVGSYMTMKSPVLWLDVDNGLRRIKKRFKALAIGHEVEPVDTLRYTSHPLPGFIASDVGSVHRIIDAANNHGARMIVFDNLGTISGSADENSGEMISVMAGLRLIAEETNCAVIAIHHQNKGNNNERAGASLRGHSSIEASVDLALRVERNEGSEAVTLRATKSRDVPFRPIDVLWTYDSEGTELKNGRFFGLEYSKGAGNLKIERAYWDILDKLASEMSQSDVIAMMQEHGVGIATTRKALDKLEADGLVTVAKGARNASLYSPVEKEPRPLAF